MKNKKMKQILSALLVFAMVIGTLASGSIMKLDGSDVLAADTEAEPVYDAEEDTLYEVTGVSGIPSGDTTATFNEGDGSVTIPSGDRARFVSGLNTTDGYYISMKLKSSSTHVTMMTRRSGYTGSAQLIFKKDGYQVNNVAGNTNLSGWKTYSSNKLSDGIQVTVYSDKTSLKVWVDGSKTVDLNNIEDQAASGAPEIYYNESADVIASNIQIWTKADKCPVYDETTDTTYDISGVTGGAYENGTITSSSATEETVFVNSNLSYDAEYFYHMTLKCDNTVQLQSRNNGTYIEFSTNGYQLFYDANTAITSQVTDAALMESMKTGLNITVHSATDRVRVWAAGKLIIDESVVDLGKAQPAITWNYEQATASDITIWTKGQKVEEGADSVAEPVFREGVDIRLNTTSEFINPTAGTDFSNGQTVGYTETYYVTFEIEMKNSEIGKNTTVFEYRPKTSSGFISGTREQITFNSNANQYTFAADNKTRQYAFQDKKVRVTLCSEPTKTSLWLDGKLVVDMLQNHNTQSFGFPRISDNKAESNFTNVCVWKKGAVAPTYDEGTCELKHSVDAYNISASGSQDFGVTLTGEETYYVSYTLKATDQVNFEYRNKTASGWITGTARDQITFYNDGYMIAGENKVSKTAGWLKNGVNVTVCSTPEKVSIWVADEKIADEKQQLTSAAIGYPRISWAQKATEVTNVKVWIEKASFTGTTATLDGVIGFNFFADLNDNMTEEDKQNTKVRFILPNGTVETVKYSKAESTTNGYKFTCNVAAKEMADSIKAELYCGTTKVDEVIYSVADYAKELLNDATQTVITKNLVTSMLTYGAKAQTYFVYNTDTLASSDITESDLTDITVSNFTQPSISQNTNIMTMTSCSLVLEGETTFKIYFTLADDVRAHDLVISSATGHTPKLGMTASGKYYIAIENIAADKLNDAINLSISTESELTAATFSGNALSYGYGVLTNPSQNTKEELTDLIKSLYKYSQYATSYIAE